MTTPTAQDLPGRTSTSVRLAVWAGVTAAAGATGTYWAWARGGMFAADAASTPAVVIPLVVAVAAVAAWLAVHRRRGREPAVAPVGPMHARPSGHSPAEVGWLLRYGTTTTDDLAATLIAMADGGLVDVDVDARTITTTGRLGQEEQQVVVDWLPGAATVDERTAAIAADPASWQRFWWAFCDAVAARGRDEGFVERSAASEEILATGLVSSSVIVAGAVGMARGYPAWFACIAAGAAILVFADTLARRSPQGAQLAARWRAFCDYLGASGDTRHADAAHAVAVGVDVALTSEQRLIVHAVAQWHRAYVTASAFLSGPSARLRAGRRS